MLSVIVPAYQAEAHLPGLLESLAVVPDWEVIIVDDGSTDDTGRIAEEWLSNRATGRYLRLAHGTPGLARQVGLEAATRDFVTYADADDQVVAPILQAGPDFLDQHSADVFIAGYESVLDHGKVRSPSPELRELKRVPSRRVLTSRAAVWGKVYRRKFLQSRAISFPPLRSADDVIFSWRLAAARPRVIETDAIGYKYWVAPHGQLTHDPEYFKCGLVSLSFLQREAQGSNLRALALADYAYWSGVAHIMRKSSLGQIPELGRSALTQFLKARSRSAK